MGDNYRIEKLAETLVTHSLRVLPRETVLIHASSECKRLVLALYRHVLKMGAHPWCRIIYPEEERIFYSYAGEGQLRYLPPADIYLCKSFDALLFIRTESNSCFLKKVTHQKLTRRAKTKAPLLKAILRARKWCVTLYPNRFLAYRSGVSLNDYKDIFYSAVQTDWKLIKAKGDRLAKILSKTHIIRIEGPNVELEFSISGRNPVVGAGRYNMPDGEVFTAPLEKSANGQIEFDMPVDFYGHVIEGAKLSFEKGVVIAASSKTRSKVLDSILQIDNGASRLGEFGIGINYNLTYPTGHVAMDEKMGGTCHLAIGNSIPGTRGRNRSAIHLDFIKDLRRGGRIFADGKMIVDSGLLLI